MPTNGSVTFTFDTGKVVGPFNAVLAEATPKDGLYLDVTKGGSGYPTPLDFNKFKTVKKISFSPGVGKSQSFSTWTYFNHKEWAVDRFTNLG